MKILEENFLEILGKLLVVFSLSLNKFYKTRRKSYREF